VVGTVVFSVRALPVDLAEDRPLGLPDVAEPDVVSITTPLALAITASPVRTVLASAEAATTLVARRPASAASDRQRAREIVIGRAWKNIVRSGCS